MRSKKRHIAIIKESKHKTISNIKSTPFDWITLFFVATPLYIACLLIWTWEMVMGIPKTNPPIAHQVVNFLMHQWWINKERYRCRHTAATLWLAAGENPEWIAKQIGHTTTEMLFRVYSRFVPNMTRQDGSAFERMLLQSVTTNPATEAAAS